MNKKLLGGGRHVMRLVFPLVLKKGLGTNIMELNFASKDLSHYLEK